MLTLKSKKEVSSPPALFNKGTLECFQKLLEALLDTKVWLDERRITGPLGDILCRGLDILINTLKTHPHSKKMACAHKTQQNKSRNHKLPLYL